VSVRSRVRSATVRLGIERQALAVRRAFLPKHARADLRDQRLLIALLSEVLEPDSACLDVGAHEGAVLRELVRLAPDGRHIAWEPLPTLAERLRAEFPGVEVRQAALSDRTAQRSFTHVLTAPAWSGLARRPTPGGDPVEQLTVRCERLDDVLPEGVSPAFLKIDVEGAEEEVLAGAAETLMRHRPLVAFEHGAGSAEYFGTTPERLHVLLCAELGYRIQGLDGDGPYDIRRFARIFASGERVNFVARPD
jgi:FkbM family methyltransferase